MNKVIPIFAQKSGVSAVLSLSSAGNMKLRDSDEDSATIKNQKTFLSDTGIDYEDFVYAHVAHGEEVAVIDKNSPRELRSVDALITRTKGVFVGVTVADCFPVYFYDLHARVCGVAHAGWRGTVKGIIPHTVEKMVEIGAKKENIFVEFGPGISQANFEFHYAEMIKEFGPYSQDRYIDAGSSLDKITIDLQAILSDQLEKIDVPLKNIQYCKECTFADEKFFSARRHHGDSHDAMLAVIGMKDTSR